MIVNVALTTLMDNEVMGIKAIGLNLTVSPNKFSVSLGEGPGFKTILVAILIVG